LEAAIRERLGDKHLEQNLRALKTGAEGQQ
jgi:hypothetical protein